MRVSRLYCDQPLGEDLICQLIGERHHYLTQVLRAAVGNQVNLFNNNGQEYCYQIETIDKKSTDLSYQHTVSTIAESAYKIALYLAVTKSQSISFGIQKAVEVGVHSIYPVITDRSNYTVKSAAAKVKHWQSIVYSSAEQCGRCLLPELHLPTKLADLRPLAHTELIALTPAASHSFSDCLKSSKYPALGLLIGPEGGFSEIDKVIFQQHGFTAAHLGARILRTETAVVGALIMSQVIKGELA